ncbi:MAG: YHS domain-containing protein, partial [Candidatus Obscuribacterales bacterium]|nr:YHS domain-containing protein [Candidatus Obscuribacterales bacterium]
MGSQSEQSPVAQAVIDPVCGMKVVPGRQTPAFEHGGEKYYFCNPRCLEKFKTEPLAYLQEKEVEAVG